MRVEENQVLNEAHKEMLVALEGLVNELQKNRKLNVKKDFSLMVADAQARKVIIKYYAIYKEAV